MKGKKSWKEWIEIIVTAVVVAIIMRVFIIQAYKIPSASMYPTLHVGDHLFVLKFVYGVKIPFTNIHLFNFYSPKRGDIIVFKCPSPRERKKDYIKRVVALPNEEILIKNKQVYINNIPLQEKYKIHTRFYSVEDSMSITDNWTSPLKVPDKNFYVLGDNRDNSYDSRFWGSVQLDLIEGKAVFIYWPIKRIGFIR